MRAVWQRVKEARVEVDGHVVGSIGRGALVLIGVQDGDTEKDARYIADKSLSLRVFEDQEGRFNRSLLDIKGQVLVVSQFTLLGDCRKGRRPSFSHAARPDEAKRLYELVANYMRQKGVKVETGQFQAMMDVYLVNHGPVTLLLDSKKAF